MKKIIRMLVFVIGFFCVMVLGCVLLPDSFGKSYQRALVTQYDYYKQLSDNKVVFIGNSSLSFGFDLDTIEQLTGRTCAILGNHAHYGLSYMMEMSKTNLCAGDIVVIEFERNSIDTCGEDLLLTGIGHRYDMYRFFIPQVRKKLLLYYPSYIKKVIKYDLIGGYEGVGSYTIDSYDNRGNMIYERKDCEVPDPTKEEVGDDFWFISFSDDNYDEEFVEYVNTYTEYCYNKGVKVYLTLPCYYDKAIVSTEEEMIAFEDKIKETFIAPLISNQKDYIYDRKYIYNSVAHLTSEGAINRTKLLYNDLVNAGAF